MSKKTFQGRVVLAGGLSGTATLSRQPFNTSGSYFENMFAGRTDGAPCTDSSNAELVGKDLTDDTLAAAGVLMADIWKDQRIVTIDMLGDGFLEMVNMGDPIAVHEDGTVEVG